jgi:integrase
MGFDFYFHACRHYFTTALSKANIPAEVIKDIVGWSEVTMVSVYCDTEVDEELGKYFKDGEIQSIKTKSLSDL